MATATTSARRPSTSNGSSTNYTTSKISSISHKSSLSSASPQKRNHPTLIYRPAQRRTNSSSTRYIDNYPLPALPPARQNESQPRSADSYTQVVDSAEGARSSPSPTESFTSTTPYANMLARPGTGHQSISSNGPPAFASMQPPSPTLETITYQHIQETSSKRISTLDYLRKA